MAIPKVDLTVDPDWTGLDLTTDSVGRKIAVCPTCKRWIVIDNYIGSRQVFQSQMPHKTDCQAVQDFINEATRKALHTPNMTDWSTIEELFAATK